MYVARATLDRTRSYIHIISYCLVFKSLLYVIYVPLTFNVNEYEIKKSRWYSTTWQAYNLNIDRYLTIVS